MLPRAIIKQRPEDFVVDELAAYEPSGVGDHVYVRFRKVGLSTDEAMRAIAKAVKADPRECGVAGMKDKVAVTTQWMSVLGPEARDPSLEARLREVSIPGVEVLEVKRHGNKLKTGHLAGNRFDLVVRGIAPEAVAPALEAFARIARDGVPNAFGAQRFGKFGDNAERARSWLTGKDRAPGDPRLRRLHFSALQSAIFNAVLEERVKDGTWTVPLDGDLLKKEETGGLFVCADVETDRARALAGEVSPTGPILGDRMKSPEREALALEQRIAAPFIEGIDLSRTRALGEGTRRALRLRVEGLVAERPSDATLAQMMKSADEIRPAAAEEGARLRVRFVLPKGAYATTVLANVFDVAFGTREETRTEE